jgi:pimeloyl-ACP methyl ester carboxylesterase
MPTAGVRTGVQLHYEVHGDHAGVPVLFIRGTGADGSRWLSQVQEYSQRYRCITFDNRGCGRSETSPGPYTVPMMADDTVALLDYLGIDRVHVSGLSLGGAIAQEIALKVPERVVTLQLHGSWARTEGYAKAYFKMAQRLLATGGPDLYYESTLLFLFPPDFINEHPDRAEAILQEMKDNSSSLEGLAAQIHANLTHDTLDRVGQITLPTLVTVGELDMCLPPYFSRQIHAAIPGSHLAVFPGGSHLFGLQDPETFNNVTLDWLTGYDPGGS